MVLPVILLMLGLVHGGCASASGPSLAGGPGFGGPGGGGLDLEYDEGDADPDVGLDTERPTARTLRIMAVGDIMLGSTYPHIDGRDLPPRELHPIDRPGHAGLMEPLAPLLREADLALGNLEGVLAAHDEPRTRPKCDHRKKGCFAFRMPPELGPWLVAAGFDFLSLANNHIMDFGEAGREATRRELDRLGIAHSGMPGDIARLTVDGLLVSIVGVSVYNHSYNLNDLPSVLSVIRAEDARADIVIVSFHAGGEGPDYLRIPHGPERFIGQNRGDLRRFSRAAIDAGADLIVGHGPHVPRAIEFYKDRLVAYSLANFATYKRFNLAGPNGLAFVLDVELDAEGRFVSGRVHPTRQLAPGGPALDPDGAVIPLLRRLSHQDFPETGVHVTDEGELLVRAPDVAATNRTGASPSPPSPPTAAVPGSSAAAEAPIGVRHLDRLHPHLRHLALELHRRAVAAQIPMRFIHGYAPYAPRTKMGPGGMANWHQFGLAFDILINDRKSITDGKRHFAEDDPQWRVIGAIADEIGLVWGGSWRSSYDPFHFEWHPGDDSVINKDDLARLLKKAGRDGKDLEAVWTLYPAPAPPGEASRAGRLEGVLRDPASPDERADRLGD